MKTRVLLIALLSATTLAACGGDDEEPAPSDNGGAATAAPDSGGGGGGGGSETLSVTAQEPFAFDPAELEAAAGEVTIEMESPSDLQAPHAIEIEGNGVEEAGQTVEPGGTSTVTAELEAGEYTYYCPVGDHQAQGMEGTLTVR